MLIFSFMNRMYLVMAFLLVGCSRAPTAVPATRVTAGVSFSIVPPESSVLVRETEKTKTWASSSGSEVVWQLVLSRSSKTYPANDDVRRLVPEEMLRGLDFTQVEVVSRAPLSIDGMPGFEVTSKAMKGGNSPIRAYCAALFAGDGTFYVLGYAPESVDMIADFRRAANTLSVK